MEGVLVLEKDEYNVAGNKMKGQKLPKGSVVGVGSRKTLSDISNLPERNQDGKLQSVLVSKEYIEKLQQDILMLKKLVADRNKIIELSAIELQKLRVTCQKLQQQNVLLAQANSQMLAELNAGKDRLKTYQHELGCKNSLLNARNLELKEKAEKARLHVKMNEADTIKSDKAGNSSQPEKEDHKPCNAKRKRQSKVQALDPDAVNSDKAKEKVDKKSLYLRRQSARFKSGEEEPTEDNSDTKTFVLAKSRILYSFSAQLSFNFEHSAKRILGDVKEICPHCYACVIRTCKRSQAARFNSEEQVQEPTEDLFQTDDARYHVSPIHNDPVHEGCPTSSAPSIKIESEAGNNASRIETQELRRVSFRPTRRAAEKVQTYKEIPLNVKMRRSE